MDRPFDGRSILRRAEREAENGQAADDECAAELAQSCAVRRSEMSYGERDATRAEADGPHKAKNRKHDASVGPDARFYRRLNQVLGPNEDYRKRRSKASLCCSIRGVKGFRIARKIGPFS